jgi:hypothetical protein
LILAAECSFVLPCHPERPAGESKDLRTTETTKDKSVRRSLDALRLLGMTKGLMIAAQLRTSVSLRAGAHTGVAIRSFFVRCLRRVSFLFRQERHERTDQRGPRELPLATPFPFGNPQAYLSGVQHAAVPSKKRVALKNCGLFLPQGNGKLFGQMTVPAIGSEIPPKNTCHQRN